MGLVKPDVLGLVSITARQQEMLIAITQQEAGRNVAEEEGGAEGILHVTEVFGVGMRVSEEPSLPFERGS
jgi:hypothetical protein